MKVTVIMLLRAYFEGNYRVNFKTSTKGNTYGD